MKLWKIMLAALVCVLMLSAVAMADHQHSWSDATAPVVVNRVGYDATQHITYYESYQWCECGAKNTIYTSEFQAHVYSNKGTVVKATTCGEMDTRVDSCACGAQTVVYFDDTKIEHDYKNVKVAEGDCKNPTMYAKICSKCNKQDGKAWPDAYGKCSFVKTVVAPTCTSKGYTEYKCSVCGYSYKEAYTECPGVTKWIDIKKPTCTEKGYSELTCTTCGHVWQKAEPAAKHETVWHAYVEPTCGKTGNEAYMSCKNCSILWAADGATKISAIPVIPARTDAHEYNENAWNKEPVPCGATGRMWNNCIVCGAQIQSTYVNNNHTFESGLKLLLGQTKGKITTQPTCTKEGAGYVFCTGCGKQTKNVVVPAKGHQGSWEYSGPATCTTDMTATFNCTVVGCPYFEFKVINPAYGHDWKEGADSVKPTCTEPGKVTRECKICGIKEYNKVVPALGHNMTKVVKVVAPTCDAQGYTVVTCATCGVGENKINYTAALGHNYSWVVVTKPSAAGNGKNEYKCSVCGNVAKTETVKYSNWYYNNTITSFGPSTRELVGGNDWYRVTPVDLTVDGVYTYDLIASNKYVVGKVTIAVNAGALTVSYKTTNNVEVNAESLLIYANKADLAAGVAVSAPVGAAIDAAANFPGDSKVLVSLVLTGNYDAAGKSTMDASAAAGMVANID